MDRSHPEIGESTVRKVIRRFIPFLIVCYFVSYLDKVNVGFAALTMNRSLGLTPSQFGFGAGVFFVAYALCEVPSNLAMARFGARRWLARIMITWGIVSAATAFVSGPHTFYLARFVLGVCEAGFFPGLVYFLGLWFPAQYRARVIGYVDLAIPLSSLFGAPLSGLLLQVHGAGLEGWQWLFLIEGVPSIVLGIIMLFWLVDGARQAHFLEEKEHTWLLTQLDNESRNIASQQGTVRSNLLRTFIHPRVLALVVVYFGTTALHQAMSFWLPQIIREFGLSNVQTGFVAAIPYLAGAVGMVFWSHSSDRRVERKGHAACALTLAVIGFAGSALVISPALKLAAFSLAAFGAYGILPVFWSIPTAFLGRTEAAAGIAYINCLGSLSGLFAPWLIGVIRQETGSFQGGLLGVAATALISLVVLLRLPLSAGVPQTLPAAAPGDSPIH